MPLLPGPWLSPRGPRSERCPRKRSRAESLSPAFGATTRPQSIARRPGATPCPPEAVSYTHLRAHETGAYH
eukprot:1640145-Pyramimonas_sp.AAC.1